MAGLLAQQAAEANYKRVIDNALYLESQKMAEKIDEEISSESYLTNARRGTN